MLKGMEGTSTTFCSDARDDIQHISRDGRVYVSKLLDFYANFNRTTSSHSQAPLAPYSQKCILCTDCKSDVTFDLSQLNLFGFFLSNVKLATIYHYLTFENDVWK